MEETVPVPQSNSTPPEQTSPSQTPPKFPFLKSPIVIVAIALVVLLSGGLIFLASRNTDRENVTVTPTPMITLQSPTPTIDSTADWKTYTSKYGYILEYPSNWKVITAQEAGDSSLENRITFEEPNQLSHGGFPYGILISLSVPHNNDKNLSAREWAESKKELSDEFFKSAEDIIIGNSKALKIANTFGGPNFTVFIPYKAKIYQISMRYYDNVNTRLQYNYEKVFDQILSTFKFTDNQTPTGSSYSCPIENTLDCKPKTDGSVNAYCEGEYLEWASKNCPGILITR